MTHMKPYEDTSKWILPSNVETVTFVLKGAILVGFFGKTIALISGNGRIAWKHPDYPIYLIEHLLTIPSVEDVKRN